VVEVEDEAGVAALLAEVVAAEDEEEAEASKTKARLLRLPRPVLSCTAPRESS
tara:strand:+ start:125 stop:283 length:159 start_codon:yes stop_codon:yes gene_type:complete